MRLIISILTVWLGDRLIPLTIMETNILTDMNGWKIRKHTMMKAFLNRAFMSKQYFSPLRKN